MLDRITELARVPLITGNRCVEHPSTVSLVAYTVAVEFLAFRIGGSSDPIGSFAACLPGAQKDIDSQREGHFPFRLNSRNYASLRVAVFL